MVKSIKSLMTQIREEQDKKRKLELLLLQSQMNPHFLYNTLASIQQLIENQDASRASTMLRAITGFFRIGISKGQDIIYVAEEIMHIENYLIIQKMRYTKDFDYELDMADEIMQHSMMKLILQPIVENAIYHGIKNKYGRGRLKVSGRVRGTNLIFEIFDDGVGIHPDHLKNLIESINKHEIDQKPITFGLKNVNQRIKLYYGEPYGIQLESMLYEFTKVLVTIPIITEQPQQEEGSHGSDYNR